MKAPTMLPAGIQSGTITVNYKDTYASTSQQNKTTTASYVTFPNGLKMLWGTVSVTTASAGTTAIFNCRGEANITFPTDFFSAVPSFLTNQISSAAYGNGQGSALDDTHAVVSCATGSATTVSASFMLIGY